MFDNEIIGVFKKNTILLQFSFYLLCLYENAMPFERFHF